MTNKEKLSQAIKLIQEVQESIGDDSSSERELKLTRKEDHILVKWSQDYPVDEIQWSFGSGKIHSLQWMWKSTDYDPPKIEGNSYKIGNVKNINKQVTVEVGSGFWSSKHEKYILSDSLSLSLDPIQEEEPGEPEEPEEPSKKLDIDIGFWYDHEVPEDNELKKLCTIGHDRNRTYESCVRVTDKGRKVVPTFGHFKSSDSIWKLEDKVGWYNSSLEQIGHENIFFVNLKDEPRHFSEGQLQAIVDAANAKLETPFTFTFTRGHLIRRYIPKGLALTGLNFYPYFTPEAWAEDYVKVTNYQEFKAHADNVLRRPRKENPGTKFVMSPQIFYGGKYSQNPWRPPPLESAEHYFRYALESEDIVAFLLWEWETTYHEDFPDEVVWYGLQEMPKLQQAWVDAINKYVEV